MSDAKSTLILHCGARELSREELDRIDPPASTTTWKPIKHAVVLDKVGTALSDAGFYPRSVRIGVSRGDHRLFATIETGTQLNCNSVTLAIAIVNSTDKSLPMSFLAGNRVTVCDNLLLRSDLMAPVRKRHTRYGLTRFHEALNKAVTGLEAFKTAERKRIARFQSRPVSDTEAESLLLRAFDKGILSHRLLPTAIKEWRQPSFEDFRPRTLWSLENALTTTLGPLVKTNPSRFTSLSLSLSGLLSEAAGPEPIENGLVETA